MTFSKVTIMALWLGVTIKFRLGEDFRRSCGMLLLLRPTRSSIRGQCNRLILIKSIIQWILMTYLPMQNICRIRTNTLFFSIPQLLMEATVHFMEIKTDISSV